MVVMGLGVALVPQSFARTTFGGAIFRNLSDESGHVHIDAIWLANNPSELVQRVVREILTPGLS
jgi:DNA-binding transcriptional LysR family regulator